MAEGEELLHAAGDGGEGDEGEGGGAEDGSEADEGPVDDDAFGEFASSCDAPECIEGAFDGGEDLQCDEAEHECAEGADGSGLGGIGKVIDQFKDLGVEFGGGWVRRVVNIEGDLGCGKGDGLGDGVDNQCVISFFEGESGDEDGECDEGADADEGIEGEGGGLYGYAVATGALEGEGEDAEDEVGAGAEVFAPEVLEFPDVFNEELVEAGAEGAYVFPDGGTGFGLLAHGVFAGCSLRAACSFWDSMCSRATRSRSSI